MISIVIVNYNAGDYLNKCLLSINKQNYDQIEIIIVDNASQDNSLDGIENFGNVKLIRNSSYA